MPILARISDTSSLEVSRLLPSMMISPSARCSGYSSNIRLKVRSKVDLPHPDGPMKAVTFRSGMSRVMFFSAWNPP